MRSALRPVSRDRSGSAGRTGSGTSPAPGLRGSSDLATVPMTVVARRISATSVPLTCVPPLGGAHAGKRTTGELAEPAKS